MSSAAPDRSVLVLRGELQGDGLERLKTDSEVAPLFDSEDAVGHGMPDAASCQPKTVFSSAWSIPPATAPTIRIHLDRLSARSCEFLIARCVAEIRDCGKTLKVFESDCFSGSALGELHL